MLPRRPGRPAVRISELHTSESHRPRRVKGAGRRSAKVQHGVVAEPCAVQPLKPVAGSVWHHCVTDPYGQACLAASIDTYIKGGWPGDLQEFLSRHHPAHRARFEAEVMGALNTVRCTTQCLTQTADAVLQWGRACRMLLAA